MKRVAVLGASGLVGATVVERLRSCRDIEVIPLIHSSGNAWRLSRSNQLKLAIVDLMDPKSIERAVDGATHVVNASRGDQRTMLEGMRNLLEASKRSNVQRLVHLSSVLVYGDPPPPESTTESAPTRPEKGTYGWIKLQQDDLLARYARSGLSGVSLCPPNIGGPYSHYFLQLVAALRERQFALLDGGTRPVNLVDVRNLSSAIELALDRGPSDGRRLFITDGEKVTWGLLIASLLPLIRRTNDVPEISLDALQTAADPGGKPRHSILKSFKHLVSSDVRAALRKDPLLGKMDFWLRSKIAQMGATVEDKFRRSIEGTIHVQKTNAHRPLDLRLSSQQLRTVRHSCEAARRELAYVPEISFEQSTSAFSRWYRAMHGLDEPYADLLAYLR